MIAIEPCFGYVFKTNIFCNLLLWQVTVIIDYRQGSGVTVIELFRLRGFEEKIIVDEVSSHS